MANNIWLGGAQATYDTWTVQITAYDAATTYKIGINGKTVSSLAAGSATLAAADLATKWGQSTERELMEATPSSATDTVTLTTNLIGVPIVPTSAVSGGAGTIGAPSNTVVATGPAFFNNLLNWSAGAVPGAGDAILIDNDNPILYGLDSSGVLVASIVHRGGAQVGLPPINVNGYTEYRGRYLKIKSTLTRIDSTSPLTNIDLGSASAATVNVFRTGTPTQNVVRALNLLGTNAANVLNAFGGNIGVAMRVGETAVFATTRLEQTTSGPPLVYFGPGVTAADATIAGGTLETESNLTGTVLCHGGKLMTRGSATVNVLTSRQEGQFICLSNGTITTLNAGPKGRVDFSQDIRPRTVTNTNIYADSTFLDPLGTITFTNAYQLVQCDYPDITIALGANRAHTVT